MIASLVSRRKAAVVIVASLVATAIAVAVVMVARSAPMIVLRLDTETLVQRVAQPKLAAFAVTGARIFPTQECSAFQPDGTFSGVVAPPEGAVVAYNWRPDGIQLTIRSYPVGEGHAPTTLEDRDENLCTLAAPQLALAIPRPGPTDPASQLPVAGPASAGAEIGASLAPRPGDPRAFDRLSEGSVEVFGRSFYRGMLFPVSAASFTLPAGSRIASPGELIPGDTPVTGSWYGLATYGEDGFHVSATTEDSELQLFRPGSYQSSETFGIGLFAGLLNDPGIGLLAFAIAAFSALAGLLSGWLSLWRDPEPVPTPAAPPPTTAPPEPLAPAPPLEATKP